MVRWGKEPQGEETADKRARRPLHGRATVEADSTAAASGVDGLAEAEEVEAAHEEQEKVLQSIVFGGPNA